MSANIRYGYMDNVAWQSKDISSLACVFVCLIQPYLAFHWGVTYSLSQCHERAGGSPKRLISYEQVWLQKKLEIISNRKLFITESFHSYLLVRMELVNKLSLGNKAVHGMK